MGGTITLVLLFGLTGPIFAVNSTLGSMPTADRFRRLIPYMTFYFAQQDRAVRPEYATYDDGSSTKEKIPQYKSNLVLPTPFRPTTRRPSKPSYGDVIRPHPFTTATTPIYITKEDAAHYDPFLYQDPYAGRVTTTFEPQDAKVLSGVPLTKSQIPRSRTLSLLQILHLLQEARKLPQSAGLSGEQTLSQILNVLRQTNMISPGTENTIAKIFYQLPRYRKINPSPIITNYGAAGVQTPTKQTFTVNPNINKLDPILPSPQPFSSVYTVPTKQTVLPVVTQSLVNTDYDYVESYEQKSLPPKLPTTKLIQLTTPTPVLNEENDLQNYDIPQPLTVPLTNIKTSTPILHKQTVTSTPPPRADDELQNYDYAPKLPQVFYKLKAQVQSFPDPSSTGSTPGRPGIDYPILSTIPQTSFSCKTQRYKGFFGDPDTSCQVWHYCDLNGGQASFLCPNGTIFSQVALTCDWWFNVRCSSTTQLYVLNERLYKYILPVTPSFPEDFTGPLVDQYLALKFKELEVKNKKKEKSNSKD